MKPSEAAKLWTLLVTAFPDGVRWLGGQQLEETERLYERFLEDLPYDRANEAIARLVATWKPTGARPFPSIAEVRAATLVQARGRRRLGGEAYGDLRRALGSARGGPPTFDDPIVARVVEGLGWREYCQSEEGDAAYRARFVELYDRLAIEAAEDAVVGQLAPAPPRRELPRGEIRQLADLVPRVLPGKDPT